MANPLKIYGADYLSVTQPPTIPDNSAFTIRVEALNPEGTLDATYVSADVDVTVKDSLDALIHTQTIPMVNGVAEDTNVVIDMGGSPNAPFSIDVATTETENDIKGVLNRDYSPIGEKTAIPFSQNKLVFTVQPVAGAIIERLNEQFTITVQAQDIGSNPINGATDLVSISLSEGHVSDAIHDGVPVLLNFNLDGVTGSFTSSAITIQGGASNTTPTEMTVTAAGYLDGVSNQFTVYDTVTTLLPNIVDSYQSRSMVNVAASWSGEAPASAPNWAAEFAEARVAVRNNPFTSPYHGTFVLNSSARVTYDHRIVFDYGAGCGASDIRRCYARYDITAVKGSVLGATVRYDNASFFYTYNASQANKANYSIKLYSISADLTGTATFGEFNNILTQALGGGGTLEDTINAVDFENSVIANGYVDFTVSPTSINSSPDLEARYAVFISSDVDNNPTPYPGAATPRQFPDIEIDTTSATLDLELRVII